MLYLFLFAGSSSLKRANKIIIIIVLILFRCSLCCSTHHQHDVSFLDTRTIYLYVRFWVWNISVQFAVERLEHAIVLWKLLVCELFMFTFHRVWAFFSEFQTSRLHRQDEGFSSCLLFCQTLQFASCSFLRKCLDRAASLWFIDIRIILIFFTWCLFRSFGIRDRLKNVESFNGELFVNCVTFRSSSTWWLVE